MRPLFPFTAIVGQDEMRQALLLVAVDPTIGGVMIFGDRGTGKTTTIRALAALLPSIRTREGCAFNCDPEAPDQSCDACRAAGTSRKVRTVPTPVVDLPLGATEDRVVGSLDLEQALINGTKRFEPGLLARAHRGFLYIDEVNLLEDHIVDLLLDVAASGENVVEREGLSVRHPARFVLVGSGNPEEGELRPQLLDRFGLSVEVGTPERLADRVEVIRRRDTFDRDPAGFLAEWEGKERRQRSRVVAARKRVASVAAPDSAIELAARLCMALGADGLRGELTLLRSARALAALEGADAVAPDHLRRVAPMALRHRLRRNPLDETGSTVRIGRAVEEVFAT
jgi:magnesium chelatase subunit I